MIINNSNNLFTQYSVQERKNNTGNTLKENMNDMIKKSLEEAYEYSEEEKQQLSASISTKLKSGAKLTQKELAYLQKYDPMLYVKIKMLQKKREILEQKLKNCKSKKEVNDIINVEISLIQKNDPDKELKLKSILDTVKEFKKTDHYKRLPETEKKADK